MEQLNLHNLKYGIVYVYCGSELTERQRSAVSLAESLVSPMKLDRIVEDGRRDLLFVARRFNVGNIGRYATVSLRLTLMDLMCDWSAAVHSYAEALMGITDGDEGDIVLDEADYYIRHMASPMQEMASHSVAQQDHTRVKKSCMKSLKNRFKDKLDSILSEEDKCAADVPDYSQSLDTECCDSCYVGVQEPELNDRLLEAEDDEVQALERERIMALERIRRQIVNYITKYHDDPKDLMQELLRGKVVIGHPGRLLVNGNLRVVLPDYDEMEIEMPAMCRTLYVLFMKLRKQGDAGIVLRNIEDYRDEIISIYGLVKPGASDKRVERSVKNLCSPYGDTLNQMISRINRCIRSVITDKDLSRDYCITGERGQQYGIGLDPQYIELPRAITGA